jgi:hypothetical protein
MTSNGSFLFRIFVFAEENLEIPLKFGDHNFQLMFSSPFYHYFIGSLSSSAKKKK